MTNAPMTIPAPDAAGPGWRRWRDGAHPDGVRNEHYDDAGRVTEREWNDGARADGVWREKYDVSGRVTHINGQPVEDGQ